MPAALLFHLVTAVAAALAIGVGVLFPALGQTHAAIRAVQAIARQPEEAPIISRNLYIGLAMIESQALYVLIVALILLFADPLAAQLTEAAARGPLAVGVLIASAAMAAVAVMTGTALSSLGQGRVTGAALVAIAEQPAAREQISTTLFISLALLESLALYALIVALILLFANPLVPLVLKG
jgi:F0F1-type ATP synthase membrane subunit c/vacuolar-type H+-ATPase subunit K